MPRLNEKEERKGAMVQRRKEIRMNFFDDFFAVHLCVFASLRLCVRLEDL